jgi:hypothetical protein
MSVLLVLALAVAVVAAARSTWSPCGLSMLSSITPLAEQGRGHRFRSTAVWFVVGALAGGVTIGAAMALGAAGLSAIGISTSVALGVLAVAALVSAVSDSRILGLTLPGHIRQVNQAWLDQYRSWVYGAGFGWQIGVGLATFIVTAAVYLMILAGALTASPAAAMLVAVVFSLVRGLAILLGRSITSPDTLIAFHRRFDAWREPVRRITIGVELAVAIVASFAVFGLGPIPLVVVALSTAIAVATWRSASDMRSVIDAPAPTPDVAPLRPSQGLKGMDQRTLQTDAVQ